MHVCILGDPACDMEAMRLSVPPDQGMTLRRWSGREQQPSAVWTSFRGHKHKSDWWLCLPAPEGDNSREASVHEGQFLGDLLGLSQLWQGDQRRLSRQVSKTTACLSRACLFFSFPRLPLPPLLLQQPPPFVEDGSLVLEMPTPIVGY